MASPASSDVVIECPSCGTRYQLPAGTISAGGRQVACAHCGETWKARPLPRPDTPPDDVLFDEDAEAELDARFGEAEHQARDTDLSAEAAHERTLAQIRAAVMANAPLEGEEALPAAPAPTGLGSESGGQRIPERWFPLARLRRALRVASVSVLLLLIGTGLVFRNEIVQRFPDLAGAYEALGLGVNVVGLEFRDVATLVSLRNGARMVEVDGRIVSVASRGLAVPAILVTLLDGGGTPIYQWSVPPQVSELGPGEVAEFTAQLTSPPEGTASVRVSFMDNRTSQGRS